MQKREKEGEREDCKKWNFAKRSLHTGMSCYVKRSYILLSTNSKVDFRTFPIGQASISSSLPPLGSWWKFPFPNSKLGLFPPGEKCFLLKSFLVCIRFEWREEEDDEEGLWWWLNSRGPSAAGYMPSCSRLRFPWGNHRCSFGYEYRLLQYLGCLPKELPPNSHQQHQQTQTIVVGVGSKVCQ